MTPASFWSWTVRFESTLVTNPEDRFSRDEAQSMPSSLLQKIYSVRDLTKAKKKYVCLLSSDRTNFLLPTLKFFSLFFGDSQGIPCLAILFPYKKLLTK